MQRINNENEHLGTNGNKNEGDEENNYKYSQIIKNIV